jgi:dienelactone hydrolase
MTPSSRLRWSRIWSHAAVLGGLAWPGAAIAVVLMTVLFAADLAAVSLRTGFGTGWDVVIVLVLTGLGLTLLGLAVMLVRLTLAAWPRPFTAALLASFVLLLIVFDRLEAGGQVGLVVSGALTLLSAALGAAVALVVRRPEELAPSERRVSWVFFIVVDAVCLAVAAWVWFPAADSSVARPRPPASETSALRAEDPSGRGRYEVLRLTYGSGHDRRRPEYAGGVAFRTTPVDASRLLKSLHGFKAVVRRWYWGFGADALPLNGRVWHPAGDGPFPLVIVVHGNHRMEDFSDPGYAYLGELLASRGYIVVSIDENFLNRSWSGDLGGEMTTRAYLLLHHLAAWRTWNDTPGHLFHRRVDLERIALIGHSRGGEVVTLAAALNRLPCLPDDCTVALDFRLPIQAVVALAPVDGTAQPASQPVPIDNVSYLVMHGSHDGDVASFEGLRAFRRARFTDGRDRFKAAVYVDRANHGNFNSRWTDDDVGVPFQRLALGESLLSAAEQRHVAEVFIGGFLEAAVNGRREYRPMFLDARAAGAWLPKTAYFTQFADASSRAVDDSSTGVDPTRGTLPGSTVVGEHLTGWRRGDVKSRLEKPSRVKAAHLTWNNATAGATGRYRLVLPESATADLRLDAESRLTLTVADTREGTDERPLDFTLEIVTADGVIARLPLSRIAPLLPMPRVRFTKLRWLDREFYGQPTEPAFQTYEVPLRLFEAPGWPSRISEIRLVFDRVATGAIAIAEIGFRQPAGGGD